MSPKPDRQRAPGGKGAGEAGSGPNEVLFDLLASLGVEETVVERHFPECEEPARNLLDWIQGHARICGIWGEIGYDGKPKGSPELSVLANGDLCPVEAVVQAEIGRESFLFEFSRKYSSDRLRVRVRTHPRNVQRIESILSQNWGQRVVIERRFRSLRSLCRLFQEVSSGFEGVTIRSDRYQGAPKLAMDHVLGLYPTDLQLEARKGASLFRFRFLGQSLSVECAWEAAAEVRELLETAEPPSDEEGAGPCAAVRVSGVSWEDLGGMPEVERTMRELIEYPLRNPEPYRRMGLAPPKGILLVGPPGTGKTTIAKILASQLDALFLSVSASDINSMWHGESEKNVARLFEDARRVASGGRLVVLFFDEIDGLCTNRDAMGTEGVMRRTFGELCREMDGLHQNTGIAVLAATNRFEDLDPALVRPGRFDRKIEIGLPAEAARAAILRIHLRKLPGNEKLAIEPLAAATEGLSGAELAAICQRAAFLAMRRHAAKHGVSLVDLRGSFLEGLFLEREDLGCAVEEIRREKNPGSIR
ncbi:MAG: AAA family ATPase [Methylacidiphilaceae bacterium]|nr:AAA family ATPase [Candidatus Methylacidiphilaceae bacterium]